MMDVSFADECDRLLAFLFLCEEHERHPLHVPLREMDGSIPLAMSSGLIDDSRFLVPVNDGEPALWPVEIKLVVSAGTDWPSGSLAFSSVKTAARLDARRFGASRWSRYMLHSRDVIAKPDGTSTSGQGICSLIGGRWINAAPATIAGGSPDRMPLALGLALAARYEWSVWLGYGDGPRVRFLSEPARAREVFRLRDIPPGRKRRAALRNWVEGHWRRYGPDDGDRAWIKRHLRGAVDFTWNGLRCRIQPPECITP